MKFSESWLREWVSPALTTEQLAAQLTMAGLEVESIEPAVPHFTGVVVGYVEAVEPHPDADRLRVCQVSIGAEKERLNIVCGASNVRANIKVPVATVGAILPGDFHIKLSKLRGVVSAGMICAANELGLSAEKAAGIWILPEDAPVGISFTEYLQSDDHVIEVNMTPNRSDSLSVLGMAREVAALNQLSLPQPEYVMPVSQHQKTMTINVGAEQACPQYHGVVVSDIDNTLPTPIWLQERLRRSGIRSHSLTVDITNYVMLELGQPLHAFDMEKISGAITVRFAQPNETLQLLNGETVTLAPDCLIIADEKQALALAGIMGGQFSAVGAETTTLLLESANFTPSVIANRGRRFGIHSDASLRFERGVDPALPIIAIKRAAALFVELAGAKIGPVASVTAKPTPAIPIHVRAARVQSLLNMPVTRAEIASILKHLQFTVNEDPKTETLTVTAPSFRHDIKLEIDVVEEVARMRGYDQLPATLPPNRSNAGQVLSPILQQRNYLATLVQRGYREIITYNFVSDSYPALLWPDQDSISLQNPLSQEMAVMRGSLWAGLLSTVIYNRKRQQARLRLCEIGKIYTRAADGTKSETLCLAGVTTGDLLTPQWDAPGRTGDFFDMKGDVLALLHQYDCQFEPANHVALHPGQSATILINKQKIGVFGAIHPRLAESLELPNQTFLFEIALDKLPNVPLAQYQAVSRFPEIHRDLAFVVQKDVTAQSMLDAIKQVSGELLSNISIFDLYSGTPLQDTEKSLGLGLTFLHPSRTLMDDEINQLIDGIVNTVKLQFKATLRE